jgi:bifunctional UDP-N-acetylglucosamine pyrophosphorylase/glucosamine-1-phosphate N-acetyltransferase
MTRNRAAIVLAAGKGTRMKSGTAKVLHAANGRPLAFYAARQALEAGCDPVVVVVGHQADEVREALSTHLPGAPLRFALQDRQLGTAHAVLSARRALGGHEGRVLILYGDVPLVQESTLRSLMAAGRRSPLALLSMRPTDPSGYGRVVRDARGRVTSIVEHRDASSEQLAVGECNAGLYDVDAAFLWAGLKKVGSRNAQGEFYLTDLVALAHELGTPAVAVEAAVEEVSGVNDRVELAAAGRVLLRRLLEKHMRAGVTIVDPASTYVDDTVALAPDVVLEPGAVLRGQTSIGRGTRVGVGCVLEDVKVGEGVKLKPYSVIEKSEVGDRCEVGPFSRLRPASVLEAEVHIGNFVELKKSRVGRGSKASHLSYLGDTTIGTRSNIGAGTITCNYDGVSKLPTVIGDDVFIGSDTQLVAPVAVGNRAYVGAGATIVRDVPEGSLALSRAPQVIKEGWADARRAERRKTVKPRRAARRS